MKHHLTAVLTLLLMASAASAETNSAKHLWVFELLSLRNTSSVDSMLHVMEKARSDGYTGVVIEDYSAYPHNSSSSKYISNLKRIHKKANKLKMDVAVTVMPIGNSMLVTDYNMAEGISVRNARFRVQDGKATIVPHEFFPQGGVERAQDGKPNNFRGARVKASLDASHKHNGRASFKLSDFTGDHGGYGGIEKKLRVRPWMLYHFSVWVKTKNIGKPNHIYLKVTNPNKHKLYYGKMKFKNTQGWTKYDVVFNSLGNSQVSLYFGIWGNKKGTLWIDNLSLQPAGGVNLVRRKGCPVRITSMDGSIVYKEGRDYDYWKDPKLGGRWTQWHKPPSIVISSSSRIKDGQELRVSYYAAMVINGFQVEACLTASKVFKYVHQDVVTLKKYLRPQYYFMNYDEIRVADQCARCRATGNTAGQLLADNIRKCTRVIKSVAPKAQIMIWSDMVNPHHNAHDHYYLVGSTLYGSWKGLSPNVIIANWSRSPIPLEKSFAFFNKLGNPQIVANYYNNPHFKVNIAKNKRAAAVAGAKIQGWMYTTWTSPGDYSQLKAYAKAIRQPISK